MAVAATSTLGWFLISLVSSTIIPAATSSALKAVNTAAPDLAVTVYSYPSCGWVEGGFIGLYRVLTASNCDMDQVGDSAWLSCNLSRDLQPNEHIDWSSTGNEYVVEDGKDQTDSARWQCGTFMESTSAGDNGIANTCYALPNSTRVCVYYGLFSLLTFGSAGEFGSIEFGD